MKYVPHWVIDALMSKRFKCHGCKKVFNHKNMRGMGIRESDLDPGKESFYIQLTCSECRKVTFFEMEEMNIIQLSENIIKEIDKDLDDVRPNKSKKLDEFNEEDMFKGRRMEKDDVPEEEAPKLIKKKEFSKITLKDVREVKKVLKPKELEYENVLEMMGLTPEEIARYGETE